MKANWLDRSGFTLIELLVILIILGVLATLMPSASPDFGPKERRLALNNARDVGMALKTYAYDHNGNFPDGNSGIEVFSVLLKMGYISDKRCLRVEGSAYTPTERVFNWNRLMFEDTMSSEFNSPKTIVARENHWALMAGLNDSGSGRWPLLFDGPASSLGNYSEKKTEKGGVWEGKVAIVVRLDGSANIETLNSDLYLQIEGQQNILKPTDSWAIGGHVVMPY